MILATNAGRSRYGRYFTTPDDMCRQLTAAVVSATFRTKPHTYTAPAFVIDD